MATPSTPQSFYVSTANQMAYLQWAISAGATSYDIQRSLDNVTFASIGTTASAEYLDSTVAIGIQYWYKVAGINGSGTGIYTPSQSVIPSISGELSLQELRQRAQQRADRVNSNFVTLPEWNFFINQAMFELYDILVTTYGDAYYMAPAAGFTSTGQQNRSFYPLPNGILTFQDTAGADFVARPIYKLLGVDLSINPAQNGWVTLHKFNFEDRNQFLYPNTASTLYGVFNCRYRIMGDNLELIPAPSSAQAFRLWYVPRMRMLLKETDTTEAGISGWLQYVIVRAAKYALDKEESDTQKLDEELLFLNKRIEAAAQNRDAGQPDTISDTRSNYGNGYSGNNGWGRGGM